MMAFALLLALQVVAPTAPLAPFPAPKMIAYTPQLKCDWGQLVSVDAQSGELRLNTPAGAVAYKVAATFPVISADGKPAGVLSTMQPGTQLRVYYVLDGGAKVQEIQLQ